MKDSEIVALYLERQETAILETETKYGKYLSTVVWRILRDESDTEEIVNDVYMRAWKAIPPTIPENLKLFLARIARNLSFDRMSYRTAGKRNAIQVELDESVPAAESGPEEAWEAREIGEVLNRFLGELDRKTCAVFVARYYYAFSITELAKRYGLSERQAKYLLQKTRGKLKEYLEKAGVTL